MRRWRQAAAAACIGLLGLSACGSQSKAASTLKSDRVYCGLIKLDLAERSGWEPLVAAQPIAGLSEPLRLHAALLGSEALAGTPVSQMVSVLGNVATDCEGKPVLSGDIFPAG